MNPGSAVLALQVSGLFETQEPSELLWGTWEAKPGQMTMITKMLTVAGTNSSELVLCKPVGSHCLSPGI